MEVAKTSWARPSFVCMDTSTGTTSAGPHPKATSSGPTCSVFTYCAVSAVRLTESSIIVSGANSPSTSSEFHSTRVGVKVSVYRRTAIALRPSGVGSSSASDRRSVSSHRVSESHPPIRNRIVAATSNPQPLLFIRRFYPQP